LCGHADGSFIFNGMVYIRGSAHSGARQSGPPTCCRTQVEGFAGNRPASG
jgi:hypothetical protein